MILSWAAFNNIRMLLMACMPVVIFYLIWLINTSENIRSEEGTLLDLVCWPDGNAIPVIITCGSVIVVVIELYGLYQLFKASLPKKEYDVTNGLYYYVWALIVTILLFLAIMFYSGLQSTIIRDIENNIDAVMERGTLQVSNIASKANFNYLASLRIDSKIKGGITQAMLRYASHLPSKVAIDRLQTRFHCCGRVNYQEWFFIPWFNSGQGTEATILSDRKFVGDNVPYSCCSMNAMWPCIHHGITQAGTIYKYNPSNKLTISEDGCEEKLISEMMSVSWRFNAVMALIIIAMILQVIAVRYLHTAYKSGLHVDNQTSCNAYLLRSDSNNEELPTKRKLFRKRKFRQSRTMQWVTAYRPGRKFNTSSASDNSSDELLKPIYE